MTTDLQTAEAARQAAEHKLATIRATTEALALERVHDLIESPQPVVVPWSDYPAFDEYNRFPGAYERPYWQTSPEDRTEGRYRPLYETEQDLRRIRADARRLFNLFPIAQGAIESLGNYTIGNGWEFQVQPKEKHKDNPAAAQLADVVQAIVDKLLERNNFVGDLDRQIDADSRVDGEAFVALYPDEREKEVRIELVEPDCILQPSSPVPLERMLGQSHKLNFWWHGVHTQFNHTLKRDDVTRPLGYHAVFDREGEMWDYLPAYRVEHIKRNVGRNGRRGVSDFLVVMQDLENEAKLRKNTAVGAAILAAIVMIRQHAPGVGQSSVERMVAASATSSYEKQVQGGPRTTYNERTPPGTVKDMPAGMEAKLGPLGELRSAVYIEVAQYLLRIISVRWQMTEGMISGDSSNNNFASALVAEGPCVKAREHDQARCASHFESLIWKALAMYCHLGALPGVQWRQIWDMLDVKAEYSSPATRDRLQQAQANVILKDAGVLSKRSFAADMGLDIDEEEANEREAAGESGDTSATQQDPLNGIQVTAAADILDKVALGTMPEIAAIGLMAGLGIDPGLATKMVQAAMMKAGEVQAQKDREMAARGNVFGGPPQDGPPANGPPKFESIGLQVVREFLVESRDAQLCELAAHALRSLVERESA